MNLFLLAEIDFVAFLPFAAFGACALFAWAVADFVMSRQGQSTARLQKIRAGLGGGDAGSRDGERPSLTRLLEAASPTFSESMKPKSEKEVGKLKQKLCEAGFRAENAIALFVTIKGIGALVGFVFGGGLGLIFSGITIYTLLYTFGTAVVFMMVPEFALSFMAKKRKEAIFLGLPDALDLMVVCVEAGLGLDQAMRKVAEELKRSHPVLSHEFRICNQALQMGQTRAEVLEELGQRNNVDDLKTLSNIMIQVDRFGTSVGTALRTQSDSMRVRRRQIAEEKAAKTAVKLIFPLVLFIFPGIFVVLVGPAAITMINEMLPAFQNGR